MPDVFIFYIPFRFLVIGNNYAPDREQADGTWIYVLQCSYMYCNSKSTFDYSNCRCQNECPVQMVLPVQVSGETYVLFSLWLFYITVYFHVYTCMVSWNVGVTKAEIIFTAEILWLLQHSHLDAYLSSSRSSLWLLETGQNMTNLRPTCSWKSLRLLSPRARNAVVKWLQVQL